jgi:HAE1 family hydrophobic/amphiphilic exporter-1/multidrug efflux pump
MTSLAISLGALPIAMSLGAASTSRIGMGVVIVGTIFSLVLTFCYSGTLFYVVTTKNIIEFEHIEEYEKMLIKMKIIKRTTQILFLFSIVGFQIQGSLDN